MSNYNLTSQQIKDSFSQLAQVSGSVEGGVSGYAIVDGTGSRKDVLHVTASRATSASYAANGGVTSVQAGTGISVNQSQGDIIVTNTQGAAATGSLLTTSSALLDTITFTKGDGSTYTNTITLVSQSLQSEDLFITVKNTSGGDIAKGLAVHATGVTGENINISLADSSVSGDMPAIGLTENAIVNNATGRVVINGRLKGVDTSGLIAGAAVYVNGAGILTVNEPTGSDLIQSIGVCGKVNAIDGEIIVQGAGRVNALPNLANGYVWKGDSNGVPQEVLASELVTTASYVNPLTQSLDLQGDFDIDGAAPTLRVNPADGGATFTSIGQFQQYSGSAAPKFAQYYIQDLTGNEATNTFFGRIINAGWPGRVAGESYSVVAGGSNAGEWVNFSLIFDQTGDIKAIKNMNMRQGAKVTGSLDVSGSINGDIVSTGLSTFNNISVSGTGSFGYIQSVTGSAKVIGDAFLILNNDTPTERYAGIIVQDSGSTTTTSSFQWDGGNNEWFLEYSDDGGATAEHGIALFGPEYGTKGSPTYLSNNTVPKSDGGHHLNDSNISDNGSIVSVNSNTQITGSLVVDGSTPAIQIGNSGVANPSVGQFASFSGSVTPRFTQYNIQDLSGNEPASSGLFRIMNAGWPGRVAGQSYTVLAGGSNAGEWVNWGLILDQTGDVKAIKQFNARQGALVTGSLDVSGSIILNGSPVVAAFPYTGSAQITGSLGVTGSIEATSLTSLGGNGFFGDSTNGTGATSLYMYGDYSGSTARFNALQFQDVSGTYPGPPPAFFGCFSGPIAGNTAGDPFALMAGGAIAGENANWGIMMDQSGDIKTLKELSIRRGANITGSLDLSGSLQVHNGLVVTGSTRGNVNTLSIASQTASIDCSLGDYFELDLVSGSDTLIETSNVHPGQTFILKTQQSDPGFGTISFAANFRFAGGVAPTATEDGTAEDIITFVSFGNNNIYTTGVKNLKIET